MIRVFGVSPGFPVVARHADAEMLSINQTKLLSALQVKKYRQKYRKFIVEGDKMVIELLQQTALRVEALYGLERWAAANAALLAPFSAIFNPVGEGELRKVSTLTTPNQVLAIVTLPEPPPLPPLLGAGCAFYLDGIRDPGNLGTIWRIADWFGFRVVLCSPDCVDGYHPRVIQASMGAFLRVPCLEVDLEQVLELSPGLPLMGAMLDGQPLFGTALPAAGLVVIGNEAEGIRPETAARLTHRLTIPRDPQGGAESLNASVAAGIIAAVLKNPATAR
jgi:RNA methyltransferase, TrmH family